MLPPGIMFFIAKLQSHWTATNREPHSQISFGNTLKHSQWFSIFFHESQRLTFLSQKILTIWKSSCDWFSLIIISKSSVLSRSILNSFSFLSMRGIWDTFVKVWRSLKLDCDWLVTQIQITLGAKPNWEWIGKTVARQNSTKRSYLCCANVANISTEHRTTCIRYWCKATYWQILHECCTNVTNTPSELSPNFNLSLHIYRATFARHSCDIHGTFVRYICDI